MADEESTAPAVTSPLSLLQVGAAAGVWDLDPAASVLEFRVRHFWGAMTVRGRFGTVSGRLEVTATGTVSGRFEAEAASVDTKNGSRDKHLRSADFFDVANHPSIVFSLDRVLPTGDDIVRATGVLTVAGRSLPIAFDARLVEPDADHVTLDGEVSVDRRADFGMKWSPLGMASSTAVLVVHATLVRSAEKAV
jgi:polyisoprenoid-binding protein YceI